MTQKRTGETAIKVFAPLFSKSGTFSRSPIGVSFCLAFSLRLWLQRKSGGGVCRKEREMIDRLVTLKYNEKNYADRKDPYENEMV